MNHAGLRIQAGLGAAMFLIGVGLSFSMWVSGALEGMAAGIGPLMAGGINLTIALGIRRRLGPETPVRVEMSRDAKSLLLALYRQVAGWPASPLGFETRSRGLRARKMQRRLMMAGFGAAVPLPNDEVVGLLESAASAYNRVAAVLSANHEIPSIAKMAARVTLAADESMAEIFHLAATLSRYPEGLEGGRLRVEGQIKALEEVADRLESLAASGVGNLENRLRSNVDDVLSELRFEQLARAELQSPEEPQIRLED